MYCKKCGAEIEPTAKFCIKCGTMVDSTSNPAAPAKKARKKLLLPFILIAVTVVMWILFGGRGYKATVKKYVGATMKADAKSLVALMPKNYVKVAIQSGGYDNKADLIDDLQQKLDDSHEDYDDYFGTGWRYDYRILDTYTYSADEVDMYLYYNNYNGMLRGTKEIMEVNYTLTVKKDSQKASTDVTLLLVKIGSSWYVTDIG